VGLTCLLQIYLKCVVTAIKWTVKRKSCKTAQWLVFQDVNVQSNTSQCPSPWSAGYLQPCGQIYHIICAESQGLQGQPLNLWVPPTLFRPPHCWCLGKPSADRFTGV